MSPKFLSLIIVFTMLFTFAIPVSAASNETSLIDEQRISISDINNTFTYAIPLDEPELYVGKVLKTVNYRVFYDDDLSYIIEFDLTFDDDTNVQVGIREVPGEYNLIYRCNQIFTFRFGNQVVNATKV